MKRMLNLSLLTVFVTIFAVGCDNAKKMEKYEKYMKEYGTKYYQEYMVGVLGQDENVITIEMLENVVNAKKDDFDLSKLSKCDKSSSVSITVDKNDRKKITKYTYDLKCD